MLVNIDVRELFLGHCTKVQNKIVEDNSDEYIPTCLQWDQSHEGFCNKLLLCRFCTSSNDKLVRHVPTIWAEKLGLKDVGSTVF